jgi:hypothetical protein
VRRYAAIAPDSLGRQLIELLDNRHTGRHPLRVALDAPRCANLEQLIGALQVGLPAIGRPLGLVRATDFYRDASLRFEYGKTDVESFYSGWLDLAALRREVLIPVAAAEHPHFLPALRDPSTNRATRVEPVALATEGVLLVVGELLLGAGLDFDVVVHISVSRSARKRLTSPEWRWTLPAFDRYDGDVDPASVADVVIRYDDPRRPAISIRVPR